MDDRRNGIGLAGLLTLLFIGLKLGGVISWPWIWVLSPIWISVLFMVVVVLLLAAGGLLVAAIASSKK